MKYIGVLFSLLLFLTAVSCDKKQVPTIVIPVYDTSLELLSSNNQTLTAGSYNTDFVQIIVKNEINEPIAGVEVTFTQISPQDRQNPFTRIDTTSATGTISLAYLADTLVGADTIQIIADGAVDSLALLALTVTPAAADTMIRITPVAATVFGTAGEFVTDTFRVRVLDTYNNPVNNERILFQTYSRCLVVVDSTAGLDFETDSIYTRTDASGEAWAQLILSINPRIDGGYPNSFNLRAIRSVSDTIGFIAASTAPSAISYYYEVQNILEDNCIACHPTALSSYDLTRYFTTVVDPIVIPGDTINSTILNYAMSTHENSLNHINAVEEDVIKLWIATYNAAPGNSGLVSYNSNIKSIIDANCLTCHGDPPDIGTTYMMTTHAQIRANDVAVPADTTSTLVVRLNPGGNMRSHVSELQADSIIYWIVSDSLRQY